MKYILGEEIFPFVSKLLPPFFVFELDLELDFESEFESDFELDFESEFESNFGSECLLPLNTILFH